MNNKLENKKSEITEIILTTIIIAIGINLITEGMLSTTEVKNTSLILLGVLICTIVILYYLNQKIKTMNVSKIIIGNIMLNLTSKKIYKIIEYPSSYKISSIVNAIILENKDVSKKYANSIEQIKKNDENFEIIKNPYFENLINSAIEYQIIDLLTDSIHIKEEDTITLDLQSLPKEISENIFIKTLTKDYKKRKVFDNEIVYEDIDSEIYCLETDEGYIYNKLTPTLPKGSKIYKKNNNSLVIKSKTYKITIEWGLENGCCPFSEADFYNFYLNDKYVSMDDIEFEYYININVKYNLLTMFCKKANNYYLWIEELIHNIVEIFDYKNCLNEQNWNLLKNIKKIK